MLTKKKKNQIIKSFATHEGDTGSPEVQVALLTYEIEDLIQHLKKHKKDISSRKGLLGKVSQRRRLLNFLKNEDQTRYLNLIKRLKLKK